MDPPPKLDMRHGFVRSILKNQIDRDEYDKNERLKVVQEKLDRKERPKRKSQAVYVPPHLRGSRTATTNGKCCCYCHGRLYWLTLHFIFGIVHNATTFIHQERQPSNITKIYVLNLSLPPSPFPLSLPLSPLFTMPQPSFIKKGNPLTSPRYI